MHGRVPSFAIFLCSAAIAICATTQAFSPSLQPSRRTSSTGVIVTGRRRKGGGEEATAATDRKEDIRTSVSSDPPVTMVCRERTKREFFGKSVLLTGASGGLGRALALRLSACGISNIVLSARDERALEEVAEECRRVRGDDDGLSTHVVACDLSDPASVDRLAEHALEACPPIDVLINNGGVSSRSRFVDTTADVDRRVMQINFLSGAALAKAIVPSMIHNGAGGRIVWISSVQGLLGIPHRSSYAASKFAVQGYCESLRAELATSGVTVHAVSPGYIRTNLSRSALTGDGKKHGKMDETTAAGADPMEVAGTILDGVAAERSEMVVAASFSTVAAIWLRLLCPGLLRYLLVRRYEKTQANKEKED